MILKELEHLKGTPNRREQELFHATEQYKTAIVSGLAIAAIRLRNVDAYHLIDLQTHGLNEHVNYMLELSQILRVAHFYQLQAKGQSLHASTLDLRLDVIDYTAIWLVLAETHPLIKQYDTCVYLRHQLHKTHPQELFSMVRREVKYPTGPVAESLGKAFRVFLASSVTLSRYSQFIDIYMVVLLKRRSSTSAQHIFNALHHCFRTAKNSVTRSLRKYVKRDISSHHPMAMYWKVVNSKLVGTRTGYSAARTTHGRRLDRHLTHV
jgi:hypothetical protein